MIGEINHNLNEINEFMEFLKNKENCLEVFIMKIKEIDSVDLIKEYFDIFLDLNLVYNSTNNELSQIFKNKIINNNIYFYNYNFLKFLETIISESNELIAFKNYFDYYIKDFDNEMILKHFKQITNINYYLAEFENIDQIIEIIYNSNNDIFCKKLPSFLVLFKNNILDIEAYNTIIQKSFNIYLENQDNLILCFFNGLFRFYIYKDYNDYIIIELIKTIIEKIFNENTNNFLINFIIQIFESMKDDLNLNLFAKEYIDYIIGNFNQNNKGLLVYILNKLMTKEDLKPYFDLIKDDFVLINLIDKFDIKELNLNLENNSNLIKIYLSLKKKEIDIDEETFNIIISSDYRIKNKFSIYLKNDQKRLIFSTLNYDHEKFNFFYNNFFNKKFINDDTKVIICNFFKNYLEKFEDKNIFNEIFNLNIIIPYCNYIFLTLYVDDDFKDL